MNSKHGHQANRRGMNGDAPPRIAPGLDVNDAPLQQGQRRATLAPVALVGCDRADGPTLLGTLEWDRISVPAEASERVLRLEVTEGAQVKAGALAAEPRWPTHGRAAGAGAGTWRAERGATIGTDPRRTQRATRCARARRWPAPAPAGSRRSSSTRAWSSCRASSWLRVPRSMLRAPPGIARWRRSLPPQAQLLELTQGTRPRADRAGRGCARGSRASAWRSCA